MKQQVSFKNWFMWALVSFFYAYQYVIRVLPNIIMPEIMAKFQIDAAAFGQFSGLYYVGYSLAHIPLGIMLDRIGPRIVLTLSILLVVLGLFPLIYGDVWIYPCIGRVLIGIGSSGAILGVFKIIRIFFPEEKFTRMLGISVTIGLIGAIYGGQPVNYLLQTLGWEHTLKAISIVGVALALGTFLITPKQKVALGNPKEMLQDVKRVLMNPLVVTICVLGGLMVGPLEGFADVWGTEFLKIVYGLSENIAASLPSFIFFGMCFGATVLSYLTDRTKSYLSVIVLSAIIMGTSFIFILVGHLSTPILSVLFFIIGIFCAYQIPLIYKASTYVSGNLTALTTACANMIIMIFGYFFHSSIGAVIDIFWDGRMYDGVPLYSPQAFIGGISVIPAGLFVAAIGIFILNMKERKRLREGK